LDAPILDFGCGTGNVTESLAQQFTDLHGYDPSEGSIELARRRMPKVSFHTSPDSLPEGHFGAAVLSGVLHHVPPAERQAVLGSVRRAMAPGGRIFIFEHNPINPLTRRAVSQCPYDDDAILLWPWEVKRQLKSAGLTCVEQDFIVFFPKLLARLRALEPHLAWLALGAQTLTYGTIPA
jgi:2-polyprenyl-3-methyl-5-hydroxy-6-metoxy-1,4-benzoquinol methylase